MAKHFLIRRATRTAAASAAMLAPAAFSMATTAESAFVLPSNRITVKDPIHKKHLLERILIDTDSKERVVLRVEMEEENFVLYQVGLPNGRVLRSGSWLLAPGPNELILDAKEWPLGTLELSVLTKKDLMKLDFERWALITAEAFSAKKTDATCNHFKAQPYICAPADEKSNAEVERPGLVVQLVRIHACHAWGREFESRPDRKKPWRTPGLFCFK